MARNRREGATSLYNKVSVEQAAAELGAETPAVPGVPETAIEKAAAVRGRRVLPWRRDDMELWELDPRKSRTRKQIEDMAETLRKHGQDVPVIARYHPDPEKRRRGIIQVLAGGTRWEGAAPDLADMPILNVDLRDVPDDKEALKLAWRTNTQHNDHTAMDNAVYFWQMLRMEGLDNPEEEPEPGDSESIKRRDATLEKVGAENGVTKGRVGQYLALLKLPPEIQIAFTPGEKPIDEEEDEKAVEWNEKHGRALLQLKAFPEEQHRLFLEIKRDKLSGNTALTRAAKLLADAQVDAGITPKPRKTRKPKGQKAAPPTDDQPVEESPIEDQPADDAQAQTEADTTSDVTDVTQDETTGGAEAEQGSAATSSHSLTLGPSATPPTSIGITSRGPALFSIGGFTNMVHAVEQAAELIEQGEGIDRGDVARAQELCQQLTQASIRLGKALGGTE